MPNRRTSGEGGGRTTLATVGALAGVSKQTVSNVLNSPGLVASDTAERVRDAIAVLGYRTNRAAQQLRTGRSRVLALRVEPALTNKVFDRFLHALTEAAGAREYRIMLYAAADDTAEITAYGEMLDRWDIDGLVLTATHPGDRRTAHLAQVGIPCVTFGRPWDGSGHHPWVDVDSAAGTRAAAEQLIKAGHRRIGYLGELSSGLWQDRMSGWHRAVQDAGMVPLSPMQCSDDIPSARAAAKRMLDLHRPSAVMCSTDMVALAVIAEIQARDLRVGADIAVVGFDNSEVAEAVGLSSVAQPLVDVARECIRLLIDVIESADSARPAEQILLPPTFVGRASTAVAG